MSIFEKHPSRFGFRPSRASRVSDSWIILGAVTLAVFVATGYILEYRFMTSYDVIEQSAVASDLRPAPRFTPNPAPAPVSTPKS